MTTKRVQKYFARLRANKKPTGRIRRSARLIIGSLLAQSEQDRIVRLREEQRARDYNRKRNEFFARFTPGSKRHDRMVLNGDYDKYAEGDSYMSRDFHRR